MPVDVKSGKTAPTLPAQQSGPEAHLIPLLAHPPHFNRDFLVGGATIDRTKVPLENGKRLAHPGDVFRFNPTTKLWDLVSGAAQADDGTGKYVMLLHVRDCTDENQSFNGLLHSRHVLKGLCKRPIPAALLGAGKPFEYHITSTLDTRS